MDFVTDKLFPSLLGRQWHEGFCGEFDPVIFLAQKKVLIDRQMESDLIMFIILEKGCFVFFFWSHEDPVLWNRAKSICWLGIIVTEYME